MRDNCFTVLLLQYPKRLLLIPVVVQVYPVWPFLLLVWVLVHHGYLMFNFFLHYVLCYHILPAIWYYIFVWCCIQCDDCYYLFESRYILCYNKMFWDSIKRCFNPLLINLWTKIYQMLNVVINLSIECASLFLSSLFLFLCVLVIDQFWVGIQSFYKIWR